MQYVELGQTGLRVSRLGVGGIPLQRGTPQAAVELLRAAHAAGVNYIDTARAYTVSEAWIGAALAELGVRDDFVLATKCRALTAADMERELAASLRDLQTACIECGACEPRCPYGLPIRQMLKRVAADFGE